MRGVLLNVNSALSVLVGNVVAVQDDAIKVIVTLEYEDVDVQSKINFLLTTDVVYWNQRTRTDDKPLIPFADRIRSMNLKAGDTIMTTVRFTDSLCKEANGYSCCYYGIFSFPPDKIHNKGRCAVRGLVTWMREKTNSNSTIYLSMGLYVGKNRQGEMLNVVVNATNGSLITYCKKILCPRQDGTKIEAAFRCGEVFLAQDDSGNVLPIYTAFEFTVTGRYKSSDME